MRRRNGNPVCGHRSFTKRARRFDEFTTDGLSLEKRRPGVDQRLKKRSGCGNLEQSNGNAALDHGRVRNDVASRRGRAHRSNSVGSSEKIDRSICGWVGPTETSMANLERLELRASLAAVATVKRLHNTARSSRR